jgi:sialic acid synthase SpsE
MGAVIIEKHFCLSRSDPGLDDPIALTPELFKKMVISINNAVKAGSEETIAFFRKERGDKLVDQVLGTGIKELSASERANYCLTNRSIHALRDIEPGEIINPSDFAVLRTEKNLRPGLEPKWEPCIAGRKAQKRIPAGEGIRFEDI